MLMETVSGSSLGGVLRAVESPVHRLLRRGIKTLKKPVQESIYTGYAKIIEVSDAGVSSPTAEVVLIQAGPGNRGHMHYYTNELLEKSVSLFEGKQCYLNHPTLTEMREQPARDLKYLVGFFSDPKIEYTTVTEADVPGFPVGSKRAQVTATFHPEEGNVAVMSKLREAAKYNSMYPGSPGYLGWSIVAGGESKPQKIGEEMYKVVTEFTEVDSIDMVTRAGAGGKLKTLMEASAMRFGLFGRARTQPADGSGLRSQLSTHVLESLKAVGVSGTAAQNKLIETAINVLPRELATPAFVMLAVSEAGIDVPEDQISDLEKKLGVEENGQMAKLLNDIYEVMPKGMKMEDDTEEAEKVAKEKAAKEVAAASKLQPDPDVTAESKKKMEAAQAESAKYKALYEAEVQKNTEGIRETHAKSLLAKADDLTEGQKKFVLDHLLEVDVKEQSTAISKFADAFGTAKLGGAPARRMQESGTSKSISFSALK